MLRAGLGGPHNRPDRPRSAGRALGRLGGIEILLVCTANRCRSPMAAALLDHELRSRGAGARVVSAGLMADGAPAVSEVVELLARRGIDAAGHASRLLTPEIVGSADLVLGLAREHLREVVALDPAAWPRTFTLKEIVRRGRSAGPRPEGADLAPWLARLGAGRRPTDLLGPSPDDDVDDPMGRRRSAFRRTLGELEVLVGELADLLVPARP